MNLLDLAVKITVDDSGVDSGLNKITSSFEKVKNNVGSVIKTASKIGSSCYHSRNSVNRRSV